MSTNGASEPSMEEILASIRNIIAQDPADSDKDFSEATAKAGPEQASGLSPFGPALAESASESEQSKPTKPLGERLRQSAKQHGATQPAAVQRTLAPGAVQGPDAGAKATASGGGAPPALDTAEVAAKASPADDFSDVFEERQKRSAAATPVAPKESSSAQPAKGQIASQIPAEPANSPMAKAAEAASQSDDDASRERQAKSNSGFTSEAKGRAAAPAAGGFDFAKLRARAPLSAAEELQRFATDTEPETEPLPFARSDAPSKSESPRASNAGSTAESGQPVVIAAMPQQVAKQDAPSPPVGLAAGTAKESGDEPIGSGETPQFEKVDPGLKSANVGFLAASPRPLEPESHEQSGSDDFFKAVAGEGAGDETSKKAEPEVVSSISEAGAKVAEAKPETEAEFPASKAAIATPDATTQQAELVETEALTKPAPNEPQEGADGPSAAGIPVSSESGGVRTLEDTVADLLRPLLKEWLENNMPRIVENALRLEVAESVKKQLEKTVRGPNGLT